MAKSTSRTPSKKRQTIKDYDLTYKVMVIGESAVGKTSLIRCYSQPDKPFCSNLLTTVGIDFVNVGHNVDGVRVRLQIWDTAGQERFRTLTAMQFRGTKGVVLVYDITNKNSFDQLVFWLKSMKQHHLDNEEFIIVGNKCDLEKDREVSTENGQALARHHGVKFYETSAKTKVNVKQVFTELAANVKDANDPFVHVNPTDVVDSGDNVIRIDGEPDEEKQTECYYSSYCCGS